MQKSNRALLEIQVERLNKAAKVNIHLDYDEYNGGYALREADDRFYWSRRYRVSARKMSYYLEGQLDALLVIAESNRRDTKVSKARRLWHHLGRAYINFAPPIRGEVVVTKYALNDGAFKKRAGLCYTIAEAQAIYEYWLNCGWLVNNPHTEST